MGDLNNIQKQLEAFMAMYKEDKAMMALRFEELSLQVTQSQKVPKEDQFGETSGRHSRESPHREGYRHGNRDNFFTVPRFPRLDFPFFDCKMDPLNRLNKCEHFSGIITRLRSRWSAWLCFTLKENGSGGSSNWKKIIRRYHGMNSRSFVIKGSAHQSEMIFG